LSILGDPFRARLDRLAHSRALSQSGADGPDRCYTVCMDRAAGTVKLDDDVREELRKLAERSGCSVDALASEVLRAYVRYQNLLAASIERGIHDLEVGGTWTVHEVLALLAQQRLARSKE